jgi:hypothetical protein
MTGRLASRAAEAEALLERFNAASEAALSALERGDGDALARALEVRDELQQEIDRVARDLAVTRSRFAPNGGSIGTQRMLAMAMQQYCGPLEQLAQAAQVLQQRLEVSAFALRESLLGQLATLENATEVAARYASSARDAHRVDVVL